MIEFKREDEEEHIEGKHINQAIAHDLFQVINVIELNLNKKKIANRLTTRYSQRMIIHTLLRMGVEQYYKELGKPIPTTKWDNTKNLVKMPKRENKDLKRPMIIDRYDD